MMWHTRLAVLFTCLSVGVCTQASGQSTGAVLDPRIAGFQQWTAALEQQINAASPTVRPEARPHVVDLQPRSLGLLQDALLRRYGRSLGNSPTRAREMIIRRYVNNLPQLRGYMAEAVFLDRNPQWGYVQRPNASQHDVYRWVPGRRPPFTGQVKYHASGRATAYARDMVKDWRSPRFFVPDDHVDRLKDLWRTRAETQQAAGNTVEAKNAWRQHARVRGIGATSSEIHEKTVEAGRAASRVQTARSVSLGLVLGLSFGRTAWDWLHGDIQTNQALYRAARPGSLLATGVLADSLVERFGTAALRDSYRRNVAVGIAVVAIDALWALHETGWRQAFYQPSFYESLGGNVGALTIGMVVGRTIAQVPIPNLYVRTGVSVVGGTAAGIVGYMAGSRVARMLFELAAPELLRQQERDRIESVRRQIDMQIGRLEDWPAVSRHILTPGHG